MESTVTKGDGTHFIKKELTQENCGDSNMKFTNYSKVKNATITTQENNYDTSNHNKCAYIRKETDKLNNPLYSRIQIQIFKCVLCNTKIVNYEHLQSHMESH